MSSAYFVCAGCGHLTAWARPPRCGNCDKDATWIDGFADLHEARMRREEVLRSIHGGSVRV